MIEPAVVSPIAAERADARGYRSSAMSSTLACMAGEVDDGTLMQRYAKGDARAFDMLYERHKGPLYRYLQRLCRSSELANDLFQEVWGKVIAARARYEVRAQFNTYLFHIAHNCAVDHFRRAATLREQSTENIDVIGASLPAATAERPEILAAAAEVRADFTKALAALPAEQRETFVLYEESGMSLQQIGKICGVNMETAKSRLRYAVAKLRAALDQHRPSTDLQQASHVTQATPTRPVRAARDASPGVES